MEKVLIGWVLILAVFFGGGKKARNDPLTLSLSHAGERGLPGKKQETDKTWIPAFLRQCSGQVAGMTKKRAEERG